MRHSTVNADANWWERVDVEEWWWSAFVACEPHTSRAARCNESLSSPPNIDIIDVFFSSLSFATGAGRCGDVVWCIAGVNGRGKAQLREQRAAASL
jgi:hypothetical protein